MDKELCMCMYLIYKRTERVHPFVVVIQVYFDGIKSRKKCHTVRTVPKSDLFKTNCFLQSHRRNFGNSQQANSKIEWFAECRYLFLFILI